MLQPLYEVEGKKLKSVTKGKVSLGTEEEKKQQAEDLKKKEEHYAKFLEAAQKKLDHYVKRVQLSTRLVGSPACLVTDEHEESPHLQRLLQRGKGGGPKTRRVMELNAGHPLITGLYERFQSNTDDPIVNDSMEILFELSLLAEGSEVADPVRLNQLTLELLQKSI
jgi:molecular chaperone HtpG